MHLSKTELEETHNLLFLETITKLLKNDIKHYKHDRD